MDFALSGTQQAWHDAAIRFVREELTADLDLAGRDERREFWLEGWRRCARFGIQGLPVSEEFGGKGQGLPVTIAAMEGLGYACPDNGLIFALNACLWTVSMPILLFGTDAQKRRYLPGLCDGSIVGANGASEPEAGSDIFSMTTTAKKTPKGYLLNGSKTWVTSGPVADLFVCYASTSPERGIMGISAFIVPKDTPGFRVVREIPKLGMRTVPMGELAFEDCRLPADALLTMRRQLERCIDHARQRKQFGKPVGKFQAVANRIVEMKLRLETCRPLVYQIGWLKAQGKDATMQAALAKLHVSDCFVKNSLDAVQIFGASGFVTETGIERDLRDSVGSLIYSGTNDIQRNIIARELGL
jgi:alkylation response protein AidB-like acyl-CoA dehydrogenase